MASTTKIMTCILALEIGNMKDVVEVSGRAASQPEVKLGIREGEQYYLQDLLYSLMLESHNDSAVAIAEHIGGSVEEFASLMNEKAVEIGCQHTHYVTPNGLDAADEKGVHSTTAVDLARVMTYCISESLQKEKFLQITGTRQREFQNVSGNRNFTCYNHNAFLDMMEGAISGKTGFTSAAGYCYVGALERDEKRFVVALLACGWPYNRTYKWQDTRKLMEYGLEHYSNKEIVCTMEQRTIPVEDGLSKDKNPLKKVSVCVKPSVPKGEQKEYLVGKDEIIKNQIIIKKSVKAPVKKGTVVGKIRFFLQNEFLEAYPIVTTEEIPKLHLKDCFNWICKFYGF